MILTSLQDSAAYHGIHPHLSRAVEFLRSLRGDEPCGRIDLHGDEAFALLQTYSTKPRDADTRLEAHRRYIDVQYVLRGSETLLWCPLHTLGSASQPHDETRDFALWMPSAPTTACLLQAGLMAVLHPWDAHAPGLQDDSGCQEVFKVVIKLAV